MTVQEYPIRVRFVGKGLDTHSVPIYELGEVLLALQRMINRAYLFSISATGANGEEALLEKRSIHKKSTRQQLSLQLAGREAGSDVYNLSWFTEKMGSQVAKAMLAQMANAASAYREKTVYTGSIHNPTSVDSNASALYGEYQALANRIRSVGDIEKIEISMQGRKIPIVIDRDTKAYIKKLQKLEYLGEAGVISGKVVTVHARSRNAVDLQMQGRNRRIRVILHDDDYQKVVDALALDKDPLFEFHGKPRLKVGYLVSEFREFVASLGDVTPSSPLPGKSIVQAPLTRKQKGTPARASMRKPIVSALAGDPIVNYPDRSKKLATSKPPSKKPPVKPRTSRK